MNKSVPTLVRIAEPKGPSGLSKVQKQFNTLIKRIDKERQRLAQWQAMMPAYQEKHASQWHPMQQSFNERRTEMAFLLDRVWPNKAFTKSEKAKLSELIATIAAELIVENANDALKQLYNQHSGGDFDAELAQEGDAVKDMMKAMFGIDLGEDALDISSPEAMMRHVAAQLERQGAQQEQREQAAPVRKPRKKSAKTLAREAHQEQEEQNISLSIREVFRKLASGLHPDREQDPRERKTALMQRANVAYGNKDLLGLLELQLEVEQIDQDAINTVGEDRLKYYNKVLAEQSAELEREVAGIVMGFTLRYRLEPEGSLSPLTVMRDLERSIKAMRHDLAAIESDLAAFQDIKIIKLTLKNYRMQAPDAGWF